MLDTYVTLLMMVTFTVFCIWELSVILDEFVALQNVCTRFSVWDVRCRVVAYSV